MNEDAVPIRLLFLDRDGTLNRSLGERPPNTPDEVELLPGVNRVLPRYVAAGWLPVVISNQGGVASGFFTEVEANVVQRTLVDMLPVPVAASYLCPHKADGTVLAYAIDCPNRKPQPGFILSALQTFHAKAGDCLFVGDSITDKQAAEAAGVPFQWADRFFARPVDRGLIAKDGLWVQLRESPTPYEASLDLRAERGGKEIGSIRLLSGHTSFTSPLAEITLDVATLYRGQGIAALLVDTVLEWAGE